MSNVDPLGGSNTTIVKFSSSTSLHVGTVLRERYVLEQVLGEGGMGRVFLANDREVIGSNPYVAIKVLGDVFREHPQSINALRREATNAQKLNHPNIVGVYNFDRDGPNVFLVMEYMKGSSLDHFIKRNKSGVPFDEAWPIVQSCAQALAYMHSKEIVHSDFKPGNVFITEDGDIKVLDLGIARSIDETAALDGRTRFDAAVLGALTPQYASCEMFEGLKPDSRDDVYALGCVAYELLTGQHPYQQLPSIEARKKSVTATKPKGLRKRQWRALQRSIALDRASRTPTAEAFLEEFGSTRPSKRTGPWIAGALTALVAVGVWAVFAPSRSSDQQFIDELLATTTSGSATPDQVHNWREQAKFNLDEAKQAFENGQDERGGYFLHDGPNSARYLYGLLLSRAPALADREFGAKGMLSVSKTYAIPAVRHYQSHDPTGALRFVCEGLGVNSQEPTLLALYSKYKHDLSAHQFGAIDECTWIPWKTETPP